VATWNEILNETQAAGSTFDIVRRRYYKLLHEKTGRNVIVYYSGWLQKPHLAREMAVDISINDGDKNGFMAAIHKLDRSEGLDLILHTPGGNMAATESIIDYLRSMFNTDIRAFVPQIAMSAGTMIACACKEIYMGKHSSIGPVDPQFDGLPAQGIVDEFERAAKEIKLDQTRLLLWTPILRQIRPAFLSECDKTTKWAKEMVRKWLETGMFATDRRKKQRAKKVTEALTQHQKNRSHSRHLNIESARAIGLDVCSLEQDQELQDAVLSVHHACVLTLESTPAYKIIENHNGIAYIQQVRQVAIR
jgi:membrane-bound ClpP family serine protease